MYTLPIPVIYTQLSLKDISILIVKYLKIKITPSGKKNLAIQVTELPE